MALKGAGRATSSVKYRPLSWIEHILRVKGHPFYLFKLWSLSSSSLFWALNSLPRLLVKPFGHGEGQAEGELASKQLLRKISLPEPQEANGMVKNRHWASLIYCPPCSISGHSPSIPACGDSLKYHPPPHSVSGIIPGCLRCACIALASIPLSFQVSQSPLASSPFGSNS